MNTNSFISYFERSFKENWDRPALSDYKGITLLYKDVARRIAKMHIIFEECHLRKGDKIALCGRNQSNWGVVFLATLTYGAVAVPILHEFKPDNVHHIVNHSDSRLLFVGDTVWECLNERTMPNLDAIISLSDFSVLFCKDESLRIARERLNERFGRKYPKNFRPEHIAYHHDKPDELAVINYTSGTTGLSKGVMLPYRSLLSNMLFAWEVLPDNYRQSLVSMLPMAHMYGLMFEFLYEISVGMHVHFLTRMPTPKIILEAFEQIKPSLIISVPLIIEKIYRRQLQPLLEKTSVKMLLKLPIIDQSVRKKFLMALNNVFGGQFYEIVIGGAAFNREAETFFKKIGFRYTVGYGMTECGPIITYEDYSRTPLYSCGKAVPRMEVKIDSPAPDTVAGEILVRGDNVFLGYYRNEEATQEAFSDDGWLHTGDIGVMDSNGYLYIRGRCKNMILGSSGQNIYPEEIEDYINNKPYVVESLVLEQDGKLVALIFPDYAAAETNGIRDHDLLRLIEEVRLKVNEELPAYAQLARVEIRPEEFEKTPKKSIKRFLYQRPK
ncbi:MAG: AMP-binding protein [Prevotellaceae bacterium]|jgi:long-chain acyl-CoA synthetase|nr:AMP-binding protein [Prevotellaceae bacterium]